MSQQTPSQCLGHRTSHQFPEQCWSWQSDLEKQYPVKPTMALTKLPLSEFQRQIRVRQWFPFEAAYSMDILRSYAQSVEAQVKTSINEYQARRNDWEDELTGLLQSEPHPEEPNFEHAGLKGHVKDLEGVFEAYFPSLQRSSALAAIYSSFENELNRFCDLVQSAVSSGLRFQDLNGNGIERARNYLIKVGGFDLTAGESEWNAITRIREVRNCFVHADGVVKEGDKTITAYTKETTLLTLCGKKLELQDGFLAEVVTALLRYCEVLARAGSVRFKDGKH